MEFPAVDVHRQTREDVYGVCTGQGYFEAINYSFTDEKHLDRLRIPEEDSRRELTRLLNPLTEEQAVMRTMLLPGLLENTCRNINYQQTDLRLFEVGKVFFQKQQGGQPVEHYQLCAVCSGRRYPGASSIHFADQQCDLLDMKGVLESLVDTLRLTGTEGPLAYELSGQDQPYVTAGTSLLLVDGEREIARIGEVRGDVLGDMGIKQPVFFLECDLDLLATLPRAGKQFVSIPRYPMVKRDIALLVPEDVRAGNLLAAIRNVNDTRVESADIFDVYSGKPIEKGMKSVALSVTYRSAKKTLDDGTVDKIHKKIVHSLMTEFGGRYREGTE
jgi:phenylalanyl-tRNA synthetase beta chain